MEIWQTAVVGIVQGFTEFLPVSSSAHIVYAERLVGISGLGLQLTIIVHFGSLLAICIALWHRLVPVTLGTISGIGQLLRGQSPWSNVDFRWGMYIIIGTIPAAIIGLSIESTVENAFADPRWPSAFLLFTGTLLFVTRWIPVSNTPLNWWRAILVGFAQALAIFPGVSRSGTTITAGLLLGADRQKAAEFSFLLAIPIILGPSLIEIASISASASAGDSAGVPALFVGMVTSLVASLIAIKWLINFVRRGRLSWFAWYCWTVGVIGLIVF